MKYLLYILIGAVCSVVLFTSMFAVDDYIIAPIQNNWPVWAQNIAAFSAIGAGFTAMFTSVSWGPAFVKWVSNL